MLLTEGLDALDGGEPLDLPVSLAVPVQTGSLIHIARGEPSAAISKEVLRAACVAVVLDASNKLRAVIGRPTSLKLDRFLVRHDTCLLPHCAALCGLLARSFYRIDLALSSAFLLALPRSVRRSPPPMLRLLSDPPCLVNRFLSLALARHLATPPFLVDLVSPFRSSVKGFLSSGVVSFTARPLIERGQHSVVAGRMQGENATLYGTTLASLFVLARTLLVTIP